jgi:hypothetical protein
MGSYFVVLAQVFQQNVIHRLWLRSAMGIMELRRTRRSYRGDHWIVPSHHSQRLKYRICRIAIEAGLEFGE